MLQDNDLVQSALTTQFRQGADALPSKPCLSFDLVDPNQRTEYCLIIYVQAMMMVISSVVDTINVSQQKMSIMSNYYSIPLSHIVEYFLLPFERTGFVVVSILMQGLLMCKLFLGVTDQST